MGRSREKISQLAALEQLRDSLKASLKDAQLLLEAPAVAGANKVGKAECVGAADLVSKNATKVALIWSDSPKLEDATAVLRELGRNALGLLALLHGHSQGAGPTLLAALRAAGAGVASACSDLVAGIVDMARAEMPPKERAVAAPKLVGRVWAACEAVKKAPPDNRAAVGRQLAQLAVSVRDVIREIREMGADAGGEDGAGEEGPGEQEGRDRRPSSSDASATPATNGARAHSSDTGGGAGGREGEDGGDGGSRQEEDRLGAEHSEPGRGASASEDGGGEGGTTGSAVEAEVASASLADLSLGGSAGGSHGPRGGSLNESLELGSEEGLSSRGGREGEEEGAKVKEVEGKGKGDGDDDDDDDDEDEDEEDENDDEDEDELNFGLDFDGKFSADELAVARAAEHVCAAVQEVLKASVYVVARWPADEVPAVAPPSQSHAGTGHLGDRAAGQMGPQAAAVERFLEVCRELSCDVDEIGASLYPPQEAALLSSHAKNLRKKAGDLVGLLILDSDERGQFKVAVDNLAGRVSIFLDAT